MIRMAKKERKIKITTGAVIREPASTRESNMSSWRSEMPVIDSKKAKDKKLEKAWLHCPDGAIFKDKDGKFKVNYKYCKGCGICAQQCPDIIKMKKVRK